MQNQTLAKLVDFLKHQPERPNSKQALVAWIYAFLLKESSSSIFREILEPIVDASFPIVNPQACRWGNMGLMFVASTRRAHRWGEKK